MGKKLPEQDLSVVFQTSKERLPWSVFNDSSTGTRAIKERQNQNDQGLLITSLIQAKKK